MNVVPKIIPSFKQKKTLRKIYLLLRIQMFVAVWDAVTIKTVVSCSRKSKIASESQKAAVAEDDDVFKELEEVTENLPSIQEDLI